jgi:hypothetical protein
MEIITVLVDGEIYRRVHAVASQRGISVSALVSELLSSLLDAPANEFEPLRREEQALRERIRLLRASDRVGCEEVHDRDTDKQPR